MGGESEGEGRRKMERAGDEGGKERVEEQNNVQCICMYMLPNAMCSIQNSHLHVHVHGCVHVESLYNYNCADVGKQVDRELVYLVKSVIPRKNILLCDTSCVYMYM